MTLTNYFFQSELTPTPSVTKEPRQKLVARSPLNNNDDKDIEPSARREESQKEEKPKVERTIIFTLEEKPQQKTQPDNYTSLKSTIDTYEKTTERPVQQQASAHLCPTQEYVPEQEPVLEPTQTASSIAICPGEQSEHQSNPSHKIDSLQQKSAGKSLLIQKTNSSRHDTAPPEQHQQQQHPPKSDKSKPSIMSIK